MFSEMRRKKQMLSIQENIAILQKCTSGVLALSCDEAYPYAIPMSYVYDDGNIYFHCATIGHKLDMIQKNPKVSFCVIDQDAVVPEQYTTYFRSVIAFGEIMIIDDGEDKKDAIEKLSIKYFPDDIPANRASIIDREWKSFYILKMTVEYVTGKQAVELVGRQ